MGVGNTLLSDEGAGVHAMRYLRDHFDDLPNTDFIDAGTLSFTLIDDIARADHLLIFDAAQFGGKAASVKLFDGIEFDRFLISGRLSVHEVGFADLMDIARLQDCMPCKRALIGIQPVVLGWGESPGKKVLEVIPKAAAIGADVIRRWSLMKAVAGRERDKGITL